MKKVKLQKLIVKSLIIRNQEKIVGGATTVQPDNTFLGDGKFTVVTAEWSFD